jgi:hypothetical protein
MHSACSPGNYARTRSDDIRPQGAGMHIPTVADEGGGMRRPTSPSRTEPGQTSVDKYQTQVVRYRADTYALVHLMHHPHRLRPSAKLVEMSCHTDNYVRATCVASIRNWKLLCCNLVGNIQYCISHDDRYSRQGHPRQLIPRATSRHSDGTPVKRTSDEPGGEPDLTTAFPHFCKSGHERETNRCGHEVRRLAAPQLRAPRVDTKFENLH